MTAIGVHLLVEFWDCDFHILNDEFFLVSALLEAAVAANCTVLHSYSYHFEPQGVTAVIVVSESHLSLHSYPEIGYMAVDIFTCGPLTMPDEALEFLKHLINPGQISAKIHKRGELCLLR